MPAPYFDYYAAVSDRILPFLTGRNIVIEQRFAGSKGIVYRRHEEGEGARDWIRIRDAADLLRWARRYAVAFHALLEGDGPGCWFALDIDSRELDLEMARIAALHALDVLAEQELRALVKFSGADGFHLMWDIPSLRGLGRATIWDLERAVVRAVAAEVERRLQDDPAAAPIRAAVGPDGPLIATSSQDSENRQAVLFDEHILKPNVNVRVPYSLHAGSGLVAIPLDRSGLERFDVERARPEVVAANPGRAELPRNDLAAVKRALAAWTQPRHEA
jgi:DNA primase